MLTLEMIAKLIFCSRGHHAKEVIERLRLIEVNRQRNVIAGRYEAAVVCSRCEATLTGFTPIGGFIDMTDEAIAADVLQRLRTDGEAFIDVEAYETEDDAGTRQTDASDG
jgi:hypothetical protein